jgi:hypothetical protein
MAQFLPGCHFNGFYKGRKNGALTLRYAKSTLRNVAWRRVSTLLYALLRAVLKKFHR